jgi:hypothetical protein
MEKEAREMVLKDHDRAEGEGKARGGVREEYTFQPKIGKKSKEIKV